MIYPPAKRSHAFLIAMLAALVSQAGFATEPLAHVIVFAPPDFRELEPASMLHCGATELARVWGDTGASAQVTLLDDAEVSERSATRERLFAALDQVAANCAKEDVMVVVLATHVVRTNGGDFLCPVDALAHEIAGDVYQVAVGNEARGSYASLVSLQEVIERMAVVPASHRLLLIDQSSVPPLADPAARERCQELVDRFASNDVRVPDDFWLMRGRSGRPSSHEGPPMTCFMRAMVSGLSGLADVNNDNRVTLSELADYAWDCAEREHLPHPTIHGKASGDAIIAQVSAEARKAYSLGAEERRELASAALQMALSAMYVERDMGTAHTALSHAGLYAPDTRTWKEVMIHRGTALAWQGHFPRAWSESQKVSQFVVAILPRNAYAYASDTTRYVQRQQLPANLVVRISRQSGNRAYVDKSFQSTLADGALSFQEAPIQGVWINIQDLKGPDSADLSSRLNTLLQSSN